MARSLLDLADSFDKKAEQIETAVSKLAVEIAVTIVTDLAYKTPVDTTNAISNWQVTLSTPAHTEIDPHFPGFNGYTYSQSAAMTVTLAKAVLEQKKPGQVIWIANNADYIQNLNNGSSRQEPAGFVERAVLLGRKKASEFKLKV